MSAGNGLRKFETKILSQKPQKFRRIRVSVHQKLVPFDHSAGERIFVQLFQTQDVIPRYKYARYDPCYGFDGEEVNENIQPVS